MPDTALLFGQEYMSERDLNFYKYHDDRENVIDSNFANQIIEDDIKFEYSSRNLLADLMDISLTNIKTAVTEDSTTSFTVTITGQFDFHGMFVNSRDVMLMPKSHHHSVSSKRFKK